MNASSFLSTVAACCSLLAGLVAAQGAPAAADAAGTPGAAETDLDTDATASATPPRGMYVETVERIQGAVVGVRGQRQGTGVFISSKGEILTSRQVINPDKLEKGTAIEVIFSDGRVEDAKVIGSDPLTQLTVIKVPAQAGSFLSLEADLADPLPGERVMTFSNATDSIFRDNQVSCSIGSVSGTVPLQTGRDYAGPVLELQALSLGAGASGGPVVDLQGRLRGLLLGWHRDGVFLGQAIPARVLAPAVAEIRARLASGEDAATEEDRQRAFVGGNFSRPLATGIVVTEVPAGTPLADAGLEVGDVILAVGGEVITERKDFDNTLMGVDPGTRLSLLVRRGGRMRDFSVVTSHLTDPGTLGLGLDDDDQPGLRVSRVQKRNDGKLQVDDRVVSINGFHTDDLADLAKLRALLYPGANVEVEYLRGRSKRATMGIKVLPRATASAEDGSAPESYEDEPQEAEGKGP